MVTTVQNNDKWGFYGEYHKLTPRPGIWLEGFCDQNDLDALAVNAKLDW